MSSCFHFHRAAMPGSPDRSLLEQLVKSEEDLLSSLDDFQTLLSFEASWSTLWADLSSRDGVDAETKSVAYATASRVATIAESLSELTAESSALDLSLSSELGAILNAIYPGGEQSTPTTRDSLAVVENAPPISMRANVDDFHCTRITPAYAAVSPLSLERVPSSSSKQQNDGPFPILREKAHEWLLRHIHNPYPSPAVKRNLADCSGVSVKSIDDWFVHMRRKVGWTAISKRYFNGIRSLTVDCAHRIFVERSGHLFYSKQIVQDFVDMKEATERLHDGKVEQSSLAKKLEAIGSSVVQSSFRKRCRPVSLYDESSDCGPRKRCRDFNEGTDDEVGARSDCSESASSGSKKRSRSVASMSNTSPPSLCSSESTSSSPEPLTPLSSPRTAHTKLPFDLFDGWFDGLCAEPNLLPLGVAEQSSTVLSRKRPLSESDSHPLMKRARHDEPADTLSSSGSASDTVPQPPVSSESNVSTQFDPLALSMPQLSQIMPLSGEDHTLEFLDTSLFQPVSDSDDVAAQIMTELNFNVPPASAWKESLLGDNAFEEAPFDFPAFGAESGPGLHLTTKAGNIASPLPDTSFIEDIFSSFWAEQNDAQQYNSEARTDAALSSVDSSSLLEGVDASTQRTASQPISLSELDFAFLDGLLQTPWIVSSDTLADP